MKIISLFFLLMFPLVAQAHERTIVVDNYKFTATPYDDVLDDSHLTILGFIIGKNTLKDVQNKLGNAEILPRNEHAPSQICYMSNKESDRTVLIFESGPLGGWKRLTAFIILSDIENLKNSDRCVKSAFVSKDIQTKSGIKLGISHERVIKILGKQGKKLDDNIFFVYETKRSITKSEIKKTSEFHTDVVKQPYFDVSSFVHAAFRGAGLYSVKIGKVESY